tara:strand:- start:1543 stop:1905 length:363 start_codon:yes stop_codon:yes gene_type:complete
MNTIYQNTTEDFIFRITMLESGEIEFTFVNRYGSDTFLSMDLEEAELFFNKLENLEDTENLLADVGIYSRRCSVHSDGSDLMIYRQKALWDCDACAYLEEQEVSDLVGCFFAFTRFQEAK